MQVKKKIVAICWYKVFPAVTGGQKGIADFYTALAKINNVTIICSKDNDYTGNEISILPILPCKKSQILNPSVYTTIKKTISKIAPETVIIEHPYYALLAPWCKKNNINFIVHTHNIEYQRLQNIGKPYWFFVKILEKYAYQNADQIWCKTIQDKNDIIYWAKINEPKISILPYGVNKPAKLLAQKEARKSIGITSNKKLILFAASFDYQPNIEAIQHLQKEILPLLDKTTLVLVCGKKSNDFKQLENEKLKIGGLVPSVDVYYAACDIVINPVRTGAGVQTKTIEAVAHNKQVICYENMTNGIPNDWIGSNVLTAQTTDDFVRLLTKKQNYNNQSAATIITWQEIIAAIQWPS